MISSIDGMFLAMTIFSAFGTIATLAGSIVGCMGTCCARNQVINLFLYGKKQGQNLTRFPS